MRFNNAWCLALLVLLSPNLFSQSVSESDLSNFKEKKLKLTGDSLLLDTLSIDPSTLEIRSNSGQTITPENYQFDFSSTTLIWKGPLPEDSIQITYRSLPLDFSKQYFRRSTELIQSEEDYFIAPQTYRPPVVGNSIFGSTRLNKTGSISRGVGFGNNQDLTVNSTLSLQLNGKITDEISVLASVTDDNIPIQPEGNTAQLQEFDQVYIQLYDDRSKLTAGDFFIERPIGYFSTYFKRAQGASFSTKMPVSAKKDLNLFTQTSLAVSRGKFAREIIQGVEGNQGPYRLRGNDGELFIIVLAGTERVFIDGLEMQRGQENDYIIDYNTAEITFTAKQLINKDKRIAVEYQYTDANYVRTLAQTSTGLESEKMKVFFNFYSEQDARNQPLQQDLSDEDRALLESVGDNTNEALAPSFTRVDEFSNDQVLYTLVDSLGYDSVFVRAGEDADNFFRVNFSEVGQGNGDYIQDGFDATGRIFVWLAPDTLSSGEIRRRGNYAPVRLLIAPRRNQMLMTGIDYSFSKKTSAYLEAGFSNTDFNTFSSIGNEDNYSHGLLAKVEHEQPLSNKEDGYKLRGNITFESLGNNFQPIEPYRSVEFNRNWNLTPEILLENQNILTGGLSLEQNKDFRIKYALNRFTAGNLYEGIKNDLNADIKKEGFELWFRGSILETEGTEKTNFTRHRSKVEKSMWVTKLGFSDEREDNRRFISGTDSLSSVAYKFYDWQFYFTNLDSAKIEYKIFYRERRDFAERSNSLNESTDATHYGAEFGLVNNPRNQLRGTISNRVLRIVDPELTEQAPESTLLGRLEHNLRLPKNLVTSNLYYEIGSGLERRQEFVYLFDPTGQGPYTWIDYNENNIRELNEFELARPEDGDRYIRVFTPTDNYERAFSNQYSHSLNINPAAALANREGFLKGLSRFSNQTAFRVQRRTREEEGANRFNPFVFSIGDSALISQSSSIRNTLFYNRTSSKFGVDYTYSNQVSKTPLTTGFEERDNVSNLLRIRYNFNPKYSIVLEQELGTRKSASDVIEGRNFSIDLLSLAQTFSYQPSTSFRISASSRYTDKNNDPSLGGEQANLVDIGLDVRFNRVESGTMFAQFNYITIEYTGESQNSLSYEMLDGLQDGRNTTWAAGIQRNLGKNMQLSLTYNGRKSEDVRAIHTGNVQVRAFF
jgi:hypothetical protein